MINEFHKNGGIDHVEKKRILDPVEERLVDLTFKKNLVTANNNVEELIRDNRLLGHLSDELIARLASKAVEMIVEKDHLLTRINAKPEKLFLITRGFGQEVNGSYKRTRQRGDIVAQYSLIQSKYITSTCGPGQRYSAVSYWGWQWVPSYYATIMY